MSDFEEFNGAFQIRTLGKPDHPEKIKLGNGMRFYTGAKFGDLIMLGKLLVSGVHVRDAMDEAGVTKFRAYRFAKALAMIRPDIKINMDPLINNKIKYQNICCVCERIFGAHKKDQNVCSQDCRDKRFINYQRKYNKTKRLTWKKKKGSLYESSVISFIASCDAANGV